MSRPHTDIILDLKAKPNKISFGTVVVTFIEDPFNPLGSKKTTTDLHGRPLSTYLAGFCLGAKYLVKVNNKLVQEPYEDLIIQPNDCITYVPVIAGGGGGGSGKQILALVAMVALTLVAGPAGTALGATMFGAGTTAALMAGYVFTGMILVAGSLLINSVLAPDAPSTSISSPELESNTYSWDGIQTSRDLNKPIPVLYGTHDLGGTVINNRFFYKGTDDWLSMQIALCHGEIEDIEISDIKIQDSDLSTFVGNPVGTDGTYSYARGTFDQPILKGFSDSFYNNGAVSRKVMYNVPYSFQTTSTNIDFFRLHVEFPKGLYHMDSQGSKSTHTVELEVKYRPVGGSTWSYLYSYVPVYVTQYHYRGYSNFYDEGGGQMSYEGWTDTNSAPPADVYNYYYLTGATRQVFSHNAMAPRIRLESSSSVALKKYFEPTTSNGTVITLPIATSGYEFVATRLTADDEEGSVYHISDSHIRFIEEINTADINYGGIALLGVELKATDQLSSSRPNVITTVTRKPIYLANAYRASTNPAWICYDILTNKHYGMGIDSTKINLNEFIRWASFCDSPTGNSTYTITRANSTVILVDELRGQLVIPKASLPANEIMSGRNLMYSLSTLVGTGKTVVNSSYIDVPLSANDITSISSGYESSGIRPAGFYYYVKFRYPLKPGSMLSYTLVNRTRAASSVPQLKFNGLFDTTTDVWSALQDVAKIGRGQVILQGTKYSCIYDSVKTISGLFNAANSNNVVVNYVNQADIATEIEVQYTDSKIGYEMTSVSIQDADSIASGTRTNKTSVTAKGITDEAGALTYGRYLLATSKYIRRIVTFDADIESITSTIGDLIAVQTDVTQYGKGGLVKAVIGSIVILDDTVYLEQGKEYTLKIKHKDTDEIIDYVFTANQMSPLDFTNFDAFPNTPIGMIKFDDFALIIYEDNEGYYSTNSLIVPIGYNIQTEDRYAFGIKDSDSLLCIITDISRDGDLVRQITAAEYNESILDFNYDNDILQRLSPTVRPKNKITDFEMSDRLVKTEASVVAMLSLTWDSVVSSYYNLYIMEDDFKNYLVMGIKGNRYEYPSTELVPEKQYRIYVEDALDMGVVAYKDYTITAFSSPPPIIQDCTITSSDSLINFNISYPQQPLDFGHYELYLDGNLVSKQLSNKFSIPATTGKLSYNFSIKVLDTIGKVSPVFSKVFTVTKASIDSVTYVQEKEYIKFNINSILGSFSIDRYEVTAPGYIGTFKEPTFNIIAEWVGEKIFTFKAYDSLGLTNGTFTLPVTVVVPGVNTLVASIDGKEALLTWNSPITGLPVDYYEIEYDSTVYKTKSNQYRIPVYWLGSKQFSVRVVNTLGNISSNTSTELIITAGTMTSLQTEVIDNNVLLRWGYLNGSLPTDTFLLYKGADINNLVLIGEKKGTFTTVFENSSGQYTYWMSPVDSAGNEGTKISATTLVNEPPDYVLNVDWYSTFTGAGVSLVSARADAGTLVLPLNTTETITSHFTSRSWTTAQAQVAAGYPLWVQPFASTGSYTEVFDYGTALGGSMVTVNIDSDNLVGTPTVALVTSVSTDGVTYTDYPGQTQVYATGFRYVKVKVTVTGANSALRLNTVNVRLDSKIKNDSGYGSVTTASTGKVVQFTKPFVDITSIQVTPNGTTARFAIYDFVDIPNPTQFTVYLYDTTGARVTGSFSWSARGY